jgi:hypothetical protein
MTRSIICVIAVPRTGSNHVIRLLRNCAGLHVASEIFHATWHNWVTAYLPMLTDISGGEVVDVETFAAWKAAHPRTFVEAMAAARDGTPFVFKLFPRHLPPDVLRDAIFGAPGIGFIILKRRPIECFISARKALVEGKWVGASTTDTRASLELGAFETWALRTQEWYARVEAETAQRSLAVAHLTYERHIRGNDNRQALAHLIAALSGLGIEDIEMPPIVKGLSVQDSEPDFRKRVANWDAFEAEAARSCPALLAWALTLPDDASSAAALAGEPIRPKAPAP